MNYGELFDYLEGKNGCNFRIENNTTVWNCENTLKFTKQFCEENNIDFAQVETTLKGTGGFCDCEVLFNSVGSIEDSEELPQLEPLPIMVEK